MTTKPPTSLNELQSRIQELDQQKDIQEAALRSSVHTLGESLRPENILLFMFGKLVSKWVDKTREKEEKQNHMKDSILGFAKRFASEAFEKGVDALAKKMFS
jgi:hypothetical protein